jgi:hypothetical protein
MAKDGEIVFWDGCKCIRGIVGGWALILSNKRVTGNIARRAQKLLGLPNGDLFDAVTWPEPFRGTFIYATNPRKRATIATKLIDKVIATNGAILGKGSHPWISRRIAPHSNLAP